MLVGVSQVHGTLLGVDLFEIAAPLLIRPRRAVARGIRFIRTAGNRSLADIPLAELERQIAEAAVNRTAVTGGRIGTDASLPLLISDANDLRTHYKAIGAVYVTTESPEDDYENVTFPPPEQPPYYHWRGRRWFAGYGWSPGFLESAHLDQWCDGLVVVVVCFVFDGGAHPYCGVAPLAVVEDL